MRNESGQANAEYVIALLVSLAVVLAGAALLSYFSAAESNADTHSSRTYLHAPYSLPPAGTGVSGQWLKDLIMH